MREDAHDLVDIENAFTVGNGDRRGNHSAHPLVFFFQSCGHLGVWTVAGFYGDDVAVDAFAGEDEIADEVQRLVAGELVVETHWFLGHHFIATDDDRALQ